MPKLTQRLTDGLALRLPLPKVGHQYHWCKDVPGFGLRLSATGDRAYILERRVNGKTLRRTLGKAAGAKAISADTARKLKITVSGELQTGHDRLVTQRVTRQTRKDDGLTLTAALEDYIKGKRRGKDGLGLKDRTKADYAGMVALGGKAQSGKPFANGPLYDIADKPLSKITPDDMRRTYETAAAKSGRKAIYAMQVLRAVLNWHGVAVPDSPLSRSTAGKDRIILAATVGAPAPVPPEKLGAWWRAAVQKAGDAGADGCRLILLTGCRPGEIFGSAFKPGLRVGDVDIKGARLKLIDTKNRKDHTVVLSKQALDILKPHCKGKAALAKVFDVLDPGKTLEGINRAAGVAGITRQRLRHTFASVAEELVSGYALKRMMNHTQAGDVTGSHYVGKSEHQLRLAWQVVADFICKK